MAKKLPKIAPRPPSTDPRADSFVRGTDKPEEHAPHAPASDIVTLLRAAPPAPEEPQPRRVDFLIRGLPPEVRRWLTEVAAHRQLQSGGRASANEVAVMVLVDAMERWKASNQ